MKKLISTADYVLEKEQIVENGYHRVFCHKVCNYAKFLKTPLDIGMFVPCDEDGNVLEEPKKYSDFLKYGSFGLLTGSEVDENSKYHKAKERVIFEGFIFVKALTAFGESEYYRFMYEEIIITNLDFKNKTVEDLIEKYSITLTQNAIKKYGI